MSGPELITLGCRLNFAESEAMRAAAAGQDDLVIVNSCAVTAEAVRQARQEIRRVARRRPGARIVVTGCAAQVEPETFAGMAEVALVLGNAEKAALAPFLLSEVEGRAAHEALGARNSTSLSTSGFLEADEAAKIRVSDIMAVRKTAPHLVAGFGTRARAFVEVQNGCDHRCTFCIIPFGRGNSRSVPAGLVVERVQALVAEGFREVVLTGVDVTSYGPDLPGAPSLGSLVERILTHVPGLERLRLSSLDSVEIDERLFALVTEEKRVMPHLHLSLQAGDDMVLKRMKRRHSRADAVRMVERLKAARPEIAIGADLIAGFPTETEAMAANSLRLIEDCDIVMGHIFPYSPRAGTPAARMPQVAGPAIKARAKALREAATRRRAAWLKGLVGSEQRVLVERSDGRGHGESFAEVVLTQHPAPSPFGLSEGSVERCRDIEARAASDASGARPSISLRTNGDSAVAVGQIVTTRITHVDGDRLIGVPA